MTLTLHVPESRDLKPRLTVFGVGGAGGNAVNNMIARALDGVDFVVANTDAQSLDISTAQNKVQLGEELTEGLGAGARPEVGARAAEESIDKITDHLMGSHMCFITAGMGGGTGTGAAPVIAQAARQMGILTVGVVTKPFQFEGVRRMRQAEAGIEELQQYVDTLIVIPNQNLFRIANEKTTFTEAFGLADDVLYQGVKGVTDLMVRPGLVNLDFADIRSVMDEMGKAMMGTGEADGEDRATLAAERAIANPLLDEVSLQGARGVLINITGGDDLTLHEVDEASNKISSEVDPNANIIFGSTYDPDMTGSIRVSVVATGIDVDENSQRTPTRSSTRDEAPAAPREPENAERDLFNSDASHSVSDERPAETNSDPVHQQPSQSATVAEENVAPQPSFESEQTRMEFVEEAVAPEPHYEPAAEYTKPTLTEEELKLRAEAVRERVHAAVAEEPVTAPEAPPSAQKSGRLGIDSMIRRMTGHGEQDANSQAVASDPAHVQAAENRAPQNNIESISARRAPQAASETAASSASDAERQRVDIPAFLRRKAN